MLETIVRLASGVAVAALTSGLLLVLVVPRLSARRLVRRFVEYVGNVEMDGTVMGPHGEGGAARVGALGKGRTGRTRTVQSREQASRARVASA